ncbi:MAG: hypothetical protein U0Q03_22965 [Acidimicrobiales bacterium]
MGHFDEGTVVQVSYDRAGSTVEINCVVVQVLARVVELLPVTPSLAPPVDTLVDVTDGARSFRATVQGSGNDLFSVLRPADLGIPRAS